MQKDALCQGSLTVFREDYFFQCIELFNIYEMVHLVSRDSKNEVAQNY